MLADERAHALACGGRYFGQGLPFVLGRTFPASSEPPRYELAAVELPHWAADLGDGPPPVLIVDAATIVPGDGPAFERCDWPRAAFLHLEGWLERFQEERSGPIQSYAYRLPAAWARAYDRAWVNRIYLFLRRWLARESGRDETTLFGPLPAARFFLTHDVDALRKTVPLRIKSTVMSGVAVLRHLASGQFAKAGARIVSAVRYAARQSDYWLFENVCKLEAERGFRSIFMFADYAPGSGAVAWLMDPGYRAEQPRVAHLARSLHAGGWQVGMHPGFKTWNDAAALSRVRAAIETASGNRVRLCRQHWLRFSWAETWRAQIAAGIGLDFTLGFNDRSGLRNGAALIYRPWDDRKGLPLDIRIIPTLLMDSQFYDYAFPDDPAAAMAPWIDEVMAVGGDASLLWHTHTMHEDYGWRAGYVALLDLLVARGAQVCAAPVDESLAKR